MLKINLSSGKKRKWILTESNETYTECLRLQINVIRQTILVENVYWLGNEHRKIRKSRNTSPDTMKSHIHLSVYSACYFTKTGPNLLWFWWLQNLPIDTNSYMLYNQLFLIHSTPFFHNTIAWPELNFIFKFSQPYPQKSNPYPWKTACSKH